MNPTMTSHDRKAPRRALTWWQRFHGALRMLALLTVGVVALGVAANAAPAQRQIGRQSGPAPAPIALEQIVAAGNTVYGLAASHQGVYEWSGLGGTWNQVFGPAQRLHTGGGILYTTDPAGNPWKFDPQLGHAARYGAWTQIGGPGLDFVATDRSFFGLGPDRKVREYDGGKWKTVRSQATGHIYGGYTLLATDNATGDVSKYNGRAEKWTQIGGPGLRFASTDQNIFGLGPDHKVRRYDGKPGKWETVRSQGTGQIYGGGTLFATDTSAGPASGDVSKFDGKAEKWTRIGGPGATFATNGDRIYGLSPDRKTVFQYTGKPGNWTSLGVPLGTPAGKQEALQRMHELTEPGDAARTAWNKARNSHQRNHWDRFGFNWDKDFCSSPGKDRLPLVDFRLACARHDFGYRNYKNLLGLQDLTRTPEGRAAKHRVDQAFLKDLQKACDSGSYKPGCYTAADGYHQSVVHFGTGDQRDRVGDKVTDVKKGFFGWPLPGSIPR